MQFKIISILIAAIFLSLSACQDHLDFNPKGTLTEAFVTTPDNADALVISAYAALGNDFWDGPLTHMWIYGSVRSDDAYKGGGRIGDQGIIHTFEVYNETQADAGRVRYLPITWEGYYEIIGRTNFALRALNSFTDAEVPNRTVRIAELHFLRGHAHFMAKKMWKFVPYITENLTNDEILEVSNRANTSDELWDKIAEDFQVGAQNLPVTQPEVGRANQLAAKAYLAKTRLYQAYEQNDNHQVTNINQSRLNEVVSLLDDVINSGQCALSDDFAENFLFGFDNNIESLFSIQYSIDDGTPFGRLQMGTALNYSLAPAYGCCWFHIPSGNMVNAFKTDANGLPLFDTFNDVFVTDDDLTPGGVAVDPRLDHTVGIAGHPFKYQPDILYDHSWERVSALYGGYGNMKEQQSGDCSCFFRRGPFYGSSVDLRIIRYADVLLMKAEALIELGRHDEARPLINQIRARAANSTGRLMLADGSPASNYLTGLYDGSNWTQDYARTALQWERRLEFAMEGDRWFDLVRWGIAEPVLNAYLEREKTIRSHLDVAQFTAGRDEYYPIPQREIDFTKGLYTQNPGY